MLEKEYKKLTTLELFKMQKIVRKHQRNQTLAADEQLLFDRFGQTFIDSERTQRRQRPWVMLALLPSVLYAVYNLFLR